MEDKVGTTLTRLSGRVQHPQAEARLWLPNQRLTNT